MYSLIAVLIVIACVLLVLVVLVQSSKGGGLVSNFSASSQIMGVRKTAFCSNLMGPIREISCAQTPSATPSL